MISLACGTGLCLVLAAKVGLVAAVALVGGSVAAKAPEAWEIETGNAAKVTELVLYTGTKLGAVRAGHKRWRAREDNEHVLIVRRPGCQPVLVLRVTS